MGAFVEDGFLGRGGFAAHVHDERQVPSGDVAAYPGDPSVVADAFDSDGADQVLVGFVAPVAFSVGVGPEDVVIHPELAESAGQVVRQHRFPAVGRAADEDGRKFGHGLSLLSVQV